MLTSFTQKIADSEEKQAECGIVAQSLLNAISHRVLRTLTRYLLTVVKSLTRQFLLLARQFLLLTRQFLLAHSSIPTDTSDDIPFVSRIIPQSLLHGCPLISLLRAANCLRISSRSSTRVRRPPPCLRPRLVPRTPAPRL